MFSLRYANIVGPRISLVTISLSFLLIALSSPVTAGTELPQRSETRTAIRQAAKLIRRGSNAEAEELLRKAIEADPSSSLAKVELGFVLNKQRRLDEAYQTLLPIAEAEPKNSRAFAVLGITMLSAGRFTDARNLFYTAIVNNKKEHLAWAGMGMLDYYENRIADSLENLRESVYLQPEEPDYLFALGQVSARAEKYSEAAGAYRLFLAVSPKSDSDRRARIRGLIDFLTVLGRANGLYASTGRGETAVKFQLVSNRPVIIVRVNGHPQPLRFVLDTGSGISVLSEATAKTLGIRPVARGGQARGIGGDGRFDIVYGLLREVEIGDVKLRTVPIYIRKFNTDLPTRVDGYIGLALISKFLTTIDYGDRTFTLNKKESGREELFGAGSLALPLRITTSGFLSGEVELQGVDTPLNFIVDTGASISVISSVVAQDERVSRFELDERLRVIGAAGVSENVPVFMLPRVTVGTHTRQDIAAIALDLGVINEAAGFEQSGILGGNFLKNFRLTFDFRNAKVVFQPLIPAKD
jgi:predicted aspartyl protease/Flp pilus assembly protein TadD